MLSCCETSGSVYSTRITLCADTDASQIRPHHGSLLGVASQWDAVPWAIFRQSEESRPSVSLICSPKSSEPTSYEKAYAKSLLNPLVQASFERQPHQEAPDKQPTVTPDVSRKETSSVQKRDWFSLIKDLSVGTYVDLVAEVVKTFREPDKFMLYVTDYTTNKSLFDYAKPEEEDEEEEEGRPGDEYGYRPRAKRRWKGPFGRMTLQVTLFPPHSYFAQESVKENDYVYLRKVHIKEPRTGGVIDGRIHGDRLFPDKINVSVIEHNDDNPRVKELKRRKLEYWKRNQLNRAQITKDLGSRDEGQQDQNSKNARKRKKEQQQQQQQKKQSVREEGQTEITTAINIKRYEPNRNSKFFTLFLLSRRYLTTVQSKLGILASPLDQ